MILTRGQLLAAAALIYAIQACSNPTQSYLKSADLDDEQGFDAPYAFVRLPVELLTESFVKTYDFNRDHFYDDHFAFGYLTEGSLARARQQLNIADGSRIVELDAKLWAKGLYDPETLAVIESLNEPADKAREDYHDYYELTSELQNLAANHPNLMTLETAGRSVRGRELWYARISDADLTDESEPKLLYIANMHGDETAGRELMIYLIRHLLNEYGSDPRVTSLVDHAQIFIMPSMNPDGFESGSRYNSRGIDLNRDFPDFTADPSDTPNGRAPETQAVMALHREHHFIMALNFHGGAVCFNMPWDTKSNRQPDSRFGDDGLVKQLARAYADANRTMRQNTRGSFDRGVTYGYEWYHLDGGMQDWSIHYRNSIHATVELSTVKSPGASSLQGYWNENKESLLRYLEQGLFGVHLRVVDANRAPVMSPSIRVSSLNRAVTYSTGYINRPALAGTQAATISAPGFQTTTFDVTPTQFDGTYKDIILTP